jgi:hypothetical protein
MSAEDINYLLRISFRRIKYGEELVPDKCNWTDETESGIAIGAF